MPLFASKEYLVNMMNCHGYFTGIFLTFQTMNIIIIYQAAGVGFRNQMAVPCRWKCTLQIELIKSNLAVTIPVLSTTAVFIVQHCEGLKLIRELHRSRWPFQMMASGWKGTIWNHLYIKKYIYIILVIYIYILYIYWAPGHQQLS